MPFATAERKRVARRVAREKQRQRAVAICHKFHRGATWCLTNYGTDLPLVSMRSLNRALQTHRAEPSAAAVQSGESTTSPFVGAAPEDPGVDLPTTVLLPHPKRCILTKREEEDLVHYIKRRDHENNAVDSSELSDKVIKILNTRRLANRRSRGRKSTPFSAAATAALRKGRVGSKFIKKLYARHPGELKRRTPQPLEVHRQAAAREGNVTRFLRRCITPSSQSQA